MISRSKRYLQFPPTLASPECEENLQNIIDNVLSGDLDRIKLGKNGISDKLYRGCSIDVAGNTVRDVVDTLKVAYDNKCAFCESKRYNPDVEHFRPKKGVVGIKRAVHPGYYWLAYEWSNLLPSCFECNKAKGNHFPIFNKERRVFGPSSSLVCYGADRIYDNSPLIDEGPQLFHPGYDSTIEQSFKFDAKGKIYGTDSAKRGKVTIEVCNLNSENLLYFRSQVINNVVEKFQIALYTDDQSIFVECLDTLKTESMDLEREYTLLYKYIYYNFDEIIIPLLPAPAQHIASEVYYNHIAPEHALQRTQ